MERRAIIKWALQLLCIVALIVVIDRGVFGLFTPQSHQMLVLHERKIKQYKGVLKSDEKFDVIFVGSSMTNDGLDPATFQTITGLRAYNAGIAANAPVHCSLEIVRQLLDRAERPKIIVYAIESFSLHQPIAPCGVKLKGEPQLVDLFSAHNNARAIKDWAKQALRGEFLPLPSQVPETTVSRRFAQYTDATLHENGWVEVRAEAKPDFVAQTGREKFLPAQVAALHELVALCRQKGVKLVLVAMPEYLTAIDAFPDVHQRAKQYLHAFSREAGLAYLDFNASGAFPYRDISYFYDTNHLNGKGAVLITKLIAQDAIFKSRRP